MGLMDKILDVMKLDPDDDFEYDNEDFEIDDEPVPKSVTKEPKVEKAEEIDFNDRKRAKEKAASKSNSKITPMRSSRSNRGAGEMEVCVVRPTSIDEEREITDTLLDGRTVVLNVEGLAVDIAQRIIDFTSGSCYAIGGNLQKISNYIFIITPANVDISGDFQGYVDGFDVNSFKSEF